MTHVPTPTREDVYVPQDDAANQAVAAAAAERVRQEFKTRRVIIHWSFASGIVLVPFLSLMILAAVFAR